MKRRMAALVALVMIGCAGAAQAQWPWSKPRPKPTPLLKATPTPGPVRAATPATPPRARPAATPVIELPDYDEETSTRLQIFLDNNNFGPGKIDGKMGEFFRKALVSYRVANGQPPTGAVDDLLGHVPEAFTTYLVREEDQQFVGTMASKPAEQAKLKSLPYRSLLEFVAERFHAEQEFLRKLNPDVDLAKLKPGDAVRVPNVRPFEVEVLEEGFLDERPELAERTLFIDTYERILTVREGGKIVAHFPITPGSKSLPAPIGTWKIVGIATMPWFRRDEGMLKYGVRTDNFHNLPPGPNNPVGILWMGINRPGIGIHGTDQPETIGRATSHGCIRLANWDAARVKEMVTKGCVVEIF